jgi:PII-like signaling protein
VLTSGPAKKVSIYVGENQQYHGHSAYAAILDFLFYRHVSGATITRGIAGFGADHHMHTTRLVELAENLPIKIEFVEAPEKVNELLPKLAEMAGTGLIEVQDTIVVKAAETKEKQSAAVTPTFKSESKAKLMRIIVGANDKWRGMPLHEAIVQSLRANEIAGATVYRGILGYGANRRIHKDSTLSLSHDAPVLISAVDSEEKLRAYLPVLEQMVQQGVVALSDVDVVKYTHDFTKQDRRKEVRS